MADRHLLGRQWLSGYGQGRFDHRAMRRFHQGHGDAEPDSCGESLRCLDGQTYLRFRT